MKPIRLSGHARQQLSYRGATEKEVVDTVQTASWAPADIGRLQCTKDFTFNAYWNGRRYQTKRIRSIFVEEVSEIVVVTVYVYYF